MRIIPACAGNTVKSCHFFVINKDHPRLCGEYHYKPTDYESTQRSSPPVRGIPMERCISSPPERIIPACAGNTCHLERMKIFAWDHPRLCGEYTLLALTKTIASGSSPPVRGILEQQISLSDYGRIIPACAGNTLSPGLQLFRVADHPRLCGEYDSEASAMNDEAGSSPPVRGILENNRIKKIEARIIPACAWNT